NRDQILSALLSVNAERCRPPLAEWQVEKIASSLSRYAPDPALLAQIISTGRVPGDELKPEVPTANEDDEIDAAALLNEPEREFDYLPFLECGGYLVRGWSHILARYPRCGKTELLVHCCRSGLHQGATILYVTEENRPLWRERLGRIPPLPGMRLFFGLGKELTKIYDRVGKGTEGIVILDTLRNLKILPADENDN